MTELTESSKRLTTENEKPIIKKWLVFIIISFALLMITVDATIVATALHTLQHELHTSVSWVGWTLTAYSFGFVLMLPLSAKLSIQFGHRKVFLLSVLVFSIASLFCGLSGNIYVLILMRIIQAIGGAGITPSATGIIVKYFGASRAQFLGLFGSIFSTGAMIGPIFGGLIVTYLHWSWIFFVNIPFGLIVLLLAYRHIPFDSDLPAEHEKLDFQGLILMGLAIISVMYAATYLTEPESHWLSFIFLGLLLVCIVSTYFLFHHLNKVPNPFIQPRFIFGKGFSAVNLLNVIHLGMVIGANSLVPLYAINRYGISELSAGTLLVANGIASVTLSIILSIYINRTGYRLPLYIGVLIVISGIGLLAVNPQWGITPFFWLMGTTFLIGTGAGIMNPAGRNAGISLAPEQSANIAAVRSLGMQVGQILTIAGATAIISDAQNMGQTQAWIYGGFAGFLLLTVVPIISKIPEVKGAW